MAAGTWWHASRAPGAGLGGGVGDNAALSGLEVLGGAQPEGKTGFL